MTEDLGLPRGWEYELTRIWNSGSRFVVARPNDYSLSTLKDIF